jgi:hypothetical protein
MRDRRPLSALRQAWRERAVQALASVVLGSAIYLKVADGYGPGSGIVASVCTMWGYVILSSYVTHFLNTRAANSDRPSGPQAPGGRWPGARP